MCIRDSARFAFQRPTAARAGLHSLTSSLGRHVQAEETHGPALHHPVRIDHLFMRVLAFLAFRLCLRNAPAGPIHSLPCNLPLGLVRMGQGIQATHSEWYGFHSTVTVLHQLPVHDVS